MLVVVNDHPNKTKVSKGCCKLFEAQNSSHLLQLKCLLFDTAFKVKHSATTSISVFIPDQRVTDSNYSQESIMKIHKPVIQRKKKHFYLIFDLHKSAKYKKFSILNFNEMRLTSTEWLHRGNSLTLTAQRFSDKLQQRISCPWGYHLIKRNHSAFIKHSGPARHELFLGVT